MIRSWFGLHKTPFAQEDVEPLRQQREILDVLMVHCQQGGLSVVQGEPGVGKSVIKEALVRNDPKRLIVPVVGRTLHTYDNTLRILCQAFGIEQDGGAGKCEARLIREAQRLNQQHKMLAPLIDDAHLLDIQCLRKLRLMLEEFPKNHNLILLGQPELLRQIGLSVNEDIRGRITYSATLLKLAPDDLRQFVLDRMERAGLGHNTLTEEALALIVRSSEGVLRRVRNLCLGALIEAVRDQTKTVDIKQVNAVLRQPHWRRDHDLAQT